MQFRTQFHWFRKKFKQLNFNIFKQLKNTLVRQKRRELMILKVQEGYEWNKTKMAQFDYYIQATFKGMLEQKKGLTLNLSAKKCLNNENNLKATSEQADIKIVGSYLDLNNNQEISNQQSLLPNQPILSCNAEIPEISEPPVIAVQSKRGTRKRSVFHNFQKHLVITLKSHIKVRRISNSDCSRSNIAVQLWQHLKASDKVSKRFLLCLLLGRLSTERNKQEVYYKQYEDIVKEFSEYSQKQINEGQEYLCREVIRQSKIILSSSVLSQRRIQHFRQFEQYYRAFIGDLEGRKVNKRASNSNILNASLLPDFQNPTLSKTGDEGSNSSA